MTLRSHPSALSSVFSIGLALAATHCAGEPKDAVVPNATSTSPEVGGTSTQTAPKQNAAEKLLGQLQKVEFAAMTERGVEYLGFAALIGGELNCPHGPCPAEWREVVKTPGVQYLVARKDGALVGVTADTFAKVLGPIETPADAVTLARLAGRAVAHCVVRGDLVDCRRATDGSGLVDVNTTDGYVVATVVPFVCPSGWEPEQPLFQLGFVRVGKDGKISDARHPLAARVAMTLAGDINLCPPQRMRGRRFEGYGDLPPERSVLAYLVRAHREESAAVIAFERLAEDLARFQAPVALVERAYAAAGDERRHAAVFLAEARALAAQLEIALCIPPLDVPPARARTLDAILFENAIEGCVNETAAAIVATHQATAWPDARLRPVLERIASDERSHALLAYEVFSWGQSVLDPGTAAVVQAARVAAVERSIAEDASPIASSLGEPDAGLVAHALQYVARELARAA